MLVFPYRGCSIKNNSSKYTIFLWLKKLHNLETCFVISEEARKIQNTIRCNTTREITKARRTILALEIAIASSRPGGGVSNSSPSFNSPNFVNKRYSISKVDNKLKSHSKKQPQLKKKRMKKRKEDRTRRRRKFKIEQDRITLGTYMAPNAILPSIMKWGTENTCKWVDACAAT